MPIRILRLPGVASRRRRWLAALALSLGFLAPSLPAQVEARSQVELEPVTSWELAAGSRALRAAEVDPRFGRLPGLPGASATTRVVRDLPSLWRVPIDDVSHPYGPSVAYRVIAPSGRDGALESDLGELIPVFVEALPTLRDARSASAEGGARLTLDLGDARRAGTYRGLLQITLTDP